jgi:CRISPR locus-related DNA-binding protein
MAAILGTLGFHPHSLIPSIRSNEGVTKVVVFTSTHPDSRKAASIVKQYCEQIGVDLRTVEMPDAFDLMRIALSMQDEVRRLQDEGERISVFNIAGGTRLMSAAALLVCILEGLNSVYVHDDSHAEIALPLLQMKYSDILTPVQKRMLHFLLAHQEGELSQKDIAVGMSMHKATVNHHVKELIDKGAISLVPMEHDRRTKVVRVEPSIALLLR